MLKIYPHPHFLLTVISCTLLALSSAEATPSLSKLQDVYESELALTKEAGYRTLSGEILAAEASVSAAVAERGEALPQKKSDPVGKEASRPWQEHQADAVRKYEEAIAALQQAREKELPALSRGGERDMWFGGNYRVFIPGASWAGIEMEEDPTADMAWRDGRSMEFERTMKSYGLDFMGVAGAPYRWAEVSHAESEYNFSTPAYYLSELEKLGIHTRVNIFPEGRAAAKDLPEWFKNKFNGTYEYIDDKGKIEISHSMSFVPVSEEFTPDCAWLPAIREFSVESAKEAAQHDNILFINMSPEQMYWNRTFPYTPVFVEGFRNWLSDKYGTVEALNARWEASLSSFEEVTPPEFYNRKVLRGWDWEKATGVKNSTAAIYDYATYAEDAMIAYEQDKKRWIEEGSETSTFILGGKGPDMYFLPSAGFARSGINLWKAKGNDTGLSNCDLYSIEPADWALNIDVVTSINNHGAFAIEFNRSDRGMAPNWHLFRGMNDWEYRTCVWTGIGHGLKGGDFWELLRLDPLKWGVDYAAIDEDFFPLDIGMEIIRTNRQTALLSEVLSGALPKRNQVAFYFPHETFNQRYNFKDEYPWSVEMSGIHEMLIRAGYAPRFISDENIEEIKDYPVVILPYSPIIPDHTNQTLATYVKEGGRLVSFGVPGKVNELMKPVDGLPLRKVFGAEILSAEPKSGTVQAGEYALTFPDEYEFTEESNGGKRISVESREAVQLEKYAPLTLDLEPETASILATWGDGAPAIIENSFGKGTAAFTAFLPGQKYMASSLEKRAIMQGWLRQLLGVVPPINCDNQNVMASLLENSTGRFLVLVNRSEEPQKANIEVGFRKVPGFWASLFDRAANRTYDLLRQTPADWKEKQLSVTIEPHMPVVFLLE